MKLEKFLKPTQEKLFKMLCKMYDGKCILGKGKFILVVGQAPIMLLAHLDTVHKDAVKTICKSADGNILMSPEGIGGDDRCGVYALVKAYELSEIKPYLLFTCDEEIGGIGADYFCKVYESGKFPFKLDFLKCLIEVDRRGNNDAVFYDCDNAEFEKYITSKGFVTASGSFSDISLVAPALGVAAVNLSSGYYNAHTQHEFINRAELDAVIDKVTEIISDSVSENFPRYEYVEKVFKGLGRFNFALDWEIEEDDYENFVEISPEYDEIYFELCYFYSKNELDKMILKHGEKILDDLYRKCFGD